MAGSGSSNKRWLIVLEGLPGSGKTGHLMYFSKHYNTVKEILSKVPNKPNEMFFLRNEIKKYSLATKPGITIMDRNYVSSLAFNFSKLAGLDPTFFSVVSWYFKSMASGEIWKPDCYVYIKTPVSVSISRKRRKQFHKVWSSKKKLRLMELFYGLYFSVVERNILTIDGRNSIAVQRRLISRFLKSLNKEE